MTSKKILLIALFLFLADFFVACCHCDPQMIEYKRCELDIYNLEYVDDVSESLSADSAFFGDFGIQLLFRQNQNTCQLKSPSLFITTAMACNCENSLGKALDMYESIKIYTIQAFDSIHPAGSNVSDYFSVTNVHPDVLTLSEYLTFANDTFNSEGSYFGTEIVSTRLTYEPDSIMARQFKVEATMNDGRVLSEMTEPVVIY